MDYDKNAEDRENHRAPGCTAEDMKADDWASTITFVIGPDQARFVVQPSVPGSIASLRTSKR